MYLFNCLVKTKIYLQVNGPHRTQNCTLLFSQLWRVGRRGCPERKKKKLDWYPDSTKRKTKVPDDYDDRNIPEVDICQETDLWQ